MSSEIQPYIYDPESEDDGEVEVEPIPHRLTMNVSEWCSCDNCERMPLEEENICCREIPQVMTRLTDTITPVACMSQHPGLEPVCLNIYALQKALNDFRTDHGSLRVRGYQRRCRHLAYRCFVSWCWGWLGRKVRVVIPACVVRRIRQEFPDTEGQYVGFRAALD
ncbi:P2X purinoceptor 7-like [Engraulis encrasicolus]|uniref:P2X purinoceptor 7-like n=1 Tax=Engraulis encrasicolus TaxID=184585 RepID=UPI002FCF7A27